MVMVLRSLGMRGIPLSRDLRVLAVSGFLMNLGFAIYQAIYTNFLVTDLHIHVTQFGLLESLREVPGFLTVAMAALTVRYRESRLCGGALLLMGAGLAAFSGAFQLWYLLIVATVMSVGFHLSMPLASSLILRASEHGRAGQRLGQVNAISSGGAMVGMASVLLTVGVIGLRGSFLPAGLVIMGGGAALLLLRDSRHAARPRLVARRRYGIYYALTLLDGSRRQIFSTFAVLALVRLYGLDVHAITVLLVFNTLVTILTTPIVGNLIDRYGERRVLAINYSVLVFLFAGYALVHNIVLLGILYCIDNAFFGFGMAIQTYLKKIAPLEDITPSLAMGTTVNHIAAVGVPVVGGLLWVTYGYQITFLAGAATCILSVVTALMMAVPGHTVQPALGSV